MKVAGRKVTDDRKSL